ncbi:hypothetical protein LQZ18_07220 [Lachnospiraceae bacterium ZAX-1]
MKLSKRDVNTLLIAVGLLLLVAAYFLAYRRLEEAATVVEEEITNVLQPRASQLAFYVENLPIYNDGIVASAKIAADSLALFPPSIRTEDLVMYAVELERDFGMRISAASFTEPVELTSFDAKTAVGQSEVVNYHAYNTTLNISTKMNYENLKKTLDHIAGDPNRTALDEMSLSYDLASGELTGSMTIRKVLVEDGSYVYRPTDVPLGKLGTSSPFGMIRVFPIDNPADAAPGAGV